ncbi:hypothetical protein ABMA27_014561 [Loxostege sticticalis]|uniref:Transposase n=1 Tax=Loxostege sticticalis TaxID=481309 RepID=A0ABR3I9C0_LOXSC
MPYRYSPQEYLNMALCYDEAGQVMLRAQQLYAERYGRHLHVRTILGAVQRHRESGSFQTRLDVGRQRHPVQLEEDVLAFFERHPVASIADAARMFGVSQYYVWRLLRNEGLHPYHFTRVQELLPADYAPRVDFCRWLLRNRTYNVLWTDECTFTRQGLFNMHNAHYWSDSNPRVIRPDHFQFRFSVNVWAGIVNGTLLGPVFLERLNTDTYLQFLQNELPELLLDVPVGSRRYLYYQHDGAPAHFSLRVRAYLDEAFQGRWIGRGSVIRWPPRSPDLTPLDFHVWGRAKDLVYGNDGHTIRTVEDLRARIINAFDVMASESEVLSSVRRHCLDRARKCVQVGGRHVQHLM